MNIGPFFPFSPITLDHKKQEEKVTEPRTFARTDIHTHRGVQINQRANTLSHRCPELTTLNLDFNSVGDEGTIALVFALSDPSRLGALANLHLNSNKCSALPSPAPCLSLITLTVAF